MKFGKVFYIDDYLTIYFLLFYAFTPFNEIFLRKFGSEMKRSQSQKKFC